MPFLYTNTQNKNYRRAVPRAANTSLDRLPAHIQQRQ